MRQIHLADRMQPDRHALSLDPFLRWPAFLVSAGVVLVLLFSLLNPEPSRHLNPAARVLYWIAHVGLPLALLQGVQSRLSRLAGVRRLGVWWQCALAGLIGSLCFTPLALWLDVLFRLPDNGVNGTACGPDCLVEEFLALAPSVVLVWLTLNAARLLRLPSIGPAETLSQPATAPVPPESGPVIADPPAVLARLPPSVGRDIVALRAELHYLRCETTLGNALILYPFGLAIKELEPVIEGIQVHRSNWVALSHVSRIDRADGRIVCVMDNGSLIPVGRRRSAEVSRRFAKG